MARRRDKQQKDARPLLPWPTRVAIHWLTNVIVLLALTPRWAAST